MNTMNVAVIGRGTSSIITALTLLKNGHRVSIFYDPNTPHINVGESTTPHIEKLIYDVLGISIHRLVDNGIFSYKMGINFVDWGCGKQFHHNFSDDGIANHFETKVFNKYIHEILESRGLVEYIPERVENYDANQYRVVINQRQFDFLVNCAGWEDENNYIKPVFETVNSALLFVDELDYDDTHTLHLATEDGWQFGLPFPKQGIFKCGYLYNKDYTSEEEARSKIDKEIHESFTWKPRYSKELLVNRRVALNGNRLFFLEPLQALSLYYTYQFAEFICEYLTNLSYDNCCRLNSVYLYEMWSYQLSLAYHYHYGSVHNSSFWKDKQHDASQFMKYNFNGNKEIFMKNIEYDTLAKDSQYSYSKIGAFSHEDHQYIHYGMSGINL